MDAQKPDVCNAVDFAWFHKVSRGFTHLTSIMVDLATASYRMAISQFDI